MRGEYLGWSGPMRGLHTDLERECGSVAGLAEDRQGSHGVLVQEVGQQGVGQEEPAHPGLTHPALTDIEVAELLAPAGTHLDMVSLPHPPPPYIIR